MGDFNYDDILNNLDQGEGAGTGDYSGVDLGIGGGILDDIQNGGGSTSDTDFTKILKALGLVGGAGGSGTNYDALLPILAMLAGGFNLGNKTGANNDAAAAIKAAADKANEQATGLIGGARDAFKPYQDAGTSAVGQLSGMVGKNNLAGMFGPVGTASDMASKFKGTMSLKQLAGK